MGTHLDRVPVVEAATSQFTMVRLFCATSPLATDEVDIESAM